MDYVKTKIGRRYWLCRPVVGQAGALRGVASFENENELDAVLALLRAGNEAHDALVQPLRERKAG